MININMKLRSLLNESIPSEKEKYFNKLKKLEQTIKNSFNRGNRRDSKIMYHLEEKWEELISKMESLGYLELTRMKDEYYDPVHGHRIGFDDIIA